MLQDNYSILFEFDKGTVVVGSLFNQGQARGYGRITHTRGRTSGGHYVHDLFTAKPLDIHHFLGYQMTDLIIVFPRIPHNPF